jgi:hypothetical protein
MVPPQRSETMCCFDDGMGCSKHLIYRCHLYFKHAPYIYMRLRGEAQGIFPPRVGPHGSQLYILSMADCPRPADLSADVQLLR